MKLSRKLCATICSAAMLLSGMLATSANAVDSTPDSSGEKIYQPITAELEGNVKVYGDLYQEYKYKGNEFKFNVKEVSSPEGSTPNPDQTVLNANYMYFECSPFTFSKPGKYVFTVTQDDTGVAGISYDNRVFTVTYTIVDKDGKLEEETFRPKVKSSGVNPAFKDVPNYEQPNMVLFANIYSAGSVSVSLTGIKKITCKDKGVHRSPKDGEFQFQLQAISGWIENHYEGTSAFLDLDKIPMPSDAVVSNVGSGFSFGDIKFDFPGNYEYTITEVKGSDPTITYSTAGVVADIKVRDVGAKLQATVQYLCVKDTKTPSQPKQVDYVEFENVYTPTPISVTPEVGKVLLGRPMKEGEFSATLTNSSAATTDSQDDTSGAASTTGEPTGESTGEPTGESTGEPSGELKQPETVKVTDVKDDKPQANGMVRRSSGIFRFSPVKLDKTGVYTYSAQEEQGSEPKVTYDNSKMSIRVTVTYDDTKKSLVAKIAYLDENGKEIKTNTPYTVGDKAAFVNRYTPDNAFVTIDSSKTLEGRDLKDGEFKFELLKDGVRLSTANNDADGNIKFKPIDYSIQDETDPVGIHEYTVREVAGNDDTIIYDPNEYKVDVKVTDDLQGSLHAEVVYPDGKPKFVNSLLPEDTEYVMPMTGLARTGASTGNIIIAGVVALLLGIAFLVVAGRKRK